MRGWIVLALSLLVSWPAPCADEGGKSRKIVLIAGKKSHGPGAHDYERTMRLFKVMLDNSNVADRVRVEVHEKGWPEDEKTLDDADTIVFYSDGRDGDKYSDAPFVTGNRLQTLEKQMRRGCGMMTMHFSTFVTDREGEKILDWVGGYFDWQDEKGEHNWYSKISQVETIELATRDHPISRGVPRMVQLRDEVYWKLRFKPEDARREKERFTPIWRALDVKDEERPPEFNTVGWALERPDGGRGFGTSVGHGYRLWSDDGIRKLFLNAIVWTAHAEVPPGGVEAKVYTDDQVKLALAGVQGTKRAILEPPLRVLLFTGNKAHAWHNGEKSTPAVKAALESDPRQQVEVSTDIEDLAAKDLSKYGAVVLNNYCNWHDPKPLSAATKEAFLKYLKSGGGLVVVHFANGAFHFSLPEAGESDWPEYRKIVRRVWDHHGKEGQKSGHDAFGRFTVDIQGDHPIVAGLKPFEVTDELYFNQAGSEPVEPLITATSKVTDKEEPLAWAYQYHDARVFQTLLGHSEMTYDSYEAREMLRRAVAWVANRKVTALPPEREKKPVSAAVVALVEGRFGQALDAAHGGLLLKTKPGDAAPPLTVQCWAKLTSKQGFNILVASEEKSSPTHWELYSYAGSGVCSVFLPGRGGEFKSEIDICDGKWHHVGFSLAEDRLKLYVDGKLALDRESIAGKASGAPEKGTDGQRAPSIAIGRLVEGTIGCQGLIDDVRITDGAIALDTVRKKPLVREDATRLLLSFDDAAELSRLQAARSTAVPKPAVSTSKPDHWGPEAIGIKWKEEDSRDDRWKNTEIGRFLASSLPLGSAAGTVAKGLSIRLGDKQEATVCYDTANMKLRAAWSGGFLKFTPARYGLIMPPLIDGEPQFLSAEGPGWEAKSIQYRGMKVYGPRVVLRYDVDGRAVEESPWIAHSGEQLHFARMFKVSPSPQQLTLILGEPLSEHDKVEIRPVADGQIAVIRSALGSTAFHVRGAPGTAKWKADGKRLRLTVPTSKSVQWFQVNFWTATEDRIEALAPEIAKAAKGIRLSFTDFKPEQRWTEQIVTKGKVAANDGPYVVDTITLPFDNPYKALFFVSGHDAYNNGMVLCTVHGDVWTVTGVEEKLERLTWKRFATGLFQPLGLVVKGENVYVLGRDQITLLRDENGDGEADHYECFNNAMPTSPGGHDYTTCLEPDEEGNFYFLTANQGIWQLSADGKKLENLAGGLRNPNGLGVGPGPVVTVAPQEGNWTPASYIGEAKSGDWFGYPGPKVTPERPLGWTQPLCFIPRRRDNSSGGQFWATSEQWGPLAGQLFHLSYGQCRMMLVLREVINGQPQGGTVDMPQLFDSGAMRGRISPYDGQLYVSGLRGWTTAATEDGSLQRVRYTGQPVTMPVKWRTLQNGIAITFAEPLSREAAEDPGNYHVEQWNYRYAESYGSPDFKVSDPKQEGHDVVRLESATLLPDGRTVFLEINDLKPVNQFTIGFALKSAAGEEFRHTIAYTIHNLQNEQIDPATLNRQNAPGRLTEEEMSKLRPGLIAELVEGKNRQRYVSRMATLQVDAPGFWNIRPKHPLKYTLSGFLHVPLKGEYALAAFGRGTTRVFVNDKEVFSSLDNPADASLAKTPLHGGYNKLRIEYETEAVNSEASLRLMWSNEHGELEPVPPTALFHRGDDPELTKAVQIEQGRQLFADRQCARCHKLPQGNWPQGIHQPPLLPSADKITSSKKRFTRQWLAAWLLDPRSMRNHVSMPRLFDGDKPEDRQAAADIAAALGSADVSTEEANRRPSEEQVAQGRKLYEDLGCIACHKLTAPQEQDEFDRISLRFAVDKYGPTELRRYLLKPHEHHPTSRMPDFQLRESEAELLAAYLESAAVGKVSAVAELTQADAERGLKLYRDLGCVNCHESPEKSSRSLVQSMFRHPTQGCLANDHIRRGKAPTMDWLPEERPAILAFISRGAMTRSLDPPARQSAELYEQLRCNACHKRDGEQGARIAVLTEESEEGLTPELLPDLTWAGEKLQRDWVQQHITGKTRDQIRPWLKARMPAFPAYAEALARGMEAEHGLAELEQRAAKIPSALLPDAKASVAIGEKLTLKENLDCRQCHGIGDFEPMGDEKTKLAPGINFAYLKDRMRHEYYSRFVLDPPRWDISTRMPKLAADGRTTKVTEFYEGDAKMQFEAIWNYIQAVGEEGE